MKVYQPEVDAGLTDIIKSNASIAFTSKANVAKTKPNQVDIDRKYWLRFKKVLAKANPNQIDLYYLNTVLVSLGWNLNDDVFSKEYAFAARNTPVDKQFNFMHDESDIIGHITSSAIFGKDGIEVTASEVDKVPNDFDIIVGAVLYTHWSDKDLQERMDKIIAEIQEGKWFVSMECLFFDFDYAVIAPDNSQYTIARNAETAYLTKHLRAYGGEGKFNGYTIGRLLKGFTFSGKGLVDNPANPGSVILNAGKDVSNFISASTKTTLDDIQHTNKGEILMADRTYTEAEFNALQDKLQKAESAAQVAAQKAVEQEVKELKDSVASLTNDKQELESSVAAQKEANTENETRIQALDTEIAEANKSNEGIAKELEDMKAEAKQAVRMAALATTSLSDERKEEVLVKFAEVSEEVFAEFVDALPKVEAKKEDDKKDKKDEDKKEDKSEASEEDKESDDAENAEAGLEDAKEEEGDIDMSAGGEDATTSARKAAASWLQGTVLKSTASIKQNEEE